MSAPSPDKKRGRKLLVAAVGVATVSYVVACSSTTSGNLMPPEDTGKADGGGETGDTGDAGFDVSSGNLVAPDTGTDDTSADTGATDAKDAADASGDGG